MIQRHTATPLSTFPTPDVRFDVVHIDLIGPLPLSQGFSYLLSCVDHFTRWPEAISIPDITAVTVAQAFLRGWIARFGVPSTIITDRGRQFESQLWNKLMSLLGFKRARTTAYHPQSNGMVERFHWQLKAALKARTNPAAWMDTLPLILLGIRTALKEDISSTAADMVYRTTILLPGEFFTASPATSPPDPSDFVSQLKSHFQTVQPIAPRQTERSSHISDRLSTATQVFICHDGIRKPLQPPYDGPFPVVSGTNISPFPYTVATIPFQSIVSNPPISIPVRPLLYILTPPFQVLHLCTVQTSLQLQPPHLLAQLVLVVACIFLRISHVTCKTLGGSDVVNTSIT